MRRRTPRRRPVATPPRAARLAARLAARTATIGVIGLGHVGLPLAVALGRAGFRVVGVDADPQRVAEVGRGISPVADVRGPALVRLVRQDRLAVTTRPAALEAADAVVICVPTPLGKSHEPDISHVVAAADDVARILRPGQLVVLESTTYPGTTEEVLLPRLAAGGRRVGRDFFLAYSPERLDPGNRRHPLTRIPKVVSGVTGVCLGLARALYEQVVVRVVPMSSPRAAETAKLFENTFRSVNVALVNELAIICRRLGVSVWEVIDAAATKPFGFTPFAPGPGIGGHCLPSDPHYLSWRTRLAGYEPRFIAFADEVNRGMPAHVVALAAEVLAQAGRRLDGARVLALGVAYKAGVGDVRESPALEVIERLLALGARVDYVDPHVPAVTLGGRRLAGLPWAGTPLERYDLVVVLTAHPEFDPARVAREATLVLDTRNLTRGLALPHLHRL